MICSITFISSFFLFAFGTFQRLRDIDFVSNNRTSGIAVVDVDHDGRFEIVVAV